MGRGVMMWLCPTISGVTSNGHPSAHPPSTYAQNQETSRLLCAFVSVVQQSSPDKKSVINGNQSGFILNQLENDYIKKKDNRTGSRRG